MADTPESRARETIDLLLLAAGWIVQSQDEANVTAGRGVAIREFPLKSGYSYSIFTFYCDY
jgi:type I restriction enzyme R subunit